MTHSNGNELRDLGFKILFSNLRAQGSLEKCLILGQGHGKYNASPRIFLCQKQGNTQSMMGTSQKTQEPVSLKEFPLTIFGAI